MAKLEITITPAAQKYIAERSEFVQLVESPHPHVGCLNHNAGPSVQLGKPPHNELDLYNHVIVDTVNIYMPKSLYIPGNFTIALWRFLWWKTLTINGWKLI